jgi:DnaJ-domain-containing protein 1
MKAKKLNVTTMDGLSGEQSVDLGFETMSSGISRRDFLTVSLAAAALLALSGCASFQGSKNDLDQATTDLRNLLDGFEGDGARHDRLASISRTIEIRCREGIELTSDFNQRVHALSRRRETPSSELMALEANYSVRRAKYREELLGVQEELRQALTKEEWDQAIQILNSGTDAFSRTRL